MVYETSYDTGLRPFNHDKTRGKWSSPKDFLFACLGHAFKLDAIFIFPVVLLRDVGIYALIPYLITLGLCVIPLVFMQSFLGQFSSSGFISVFRISPLFKGIGYVSLAINLTSLTYYAVLGAIPLYYLLHTFNPIIPWSCEGFKSWVYKGVNKSQGEYESICNYNHTQSDYRVMVEVPSVDFFSNKMHIMTMYRRPHPEFRFSLLLMLCTFVIWGIIAIIATRSIESIGKFLRYSCITVLGIMGLCLLRFLFLPGVFHSVKTTLHPNVIMGDTFLFVPMVAFAALGPGWGSILTMASYNKFDTNIFRYSWLLCFAQIGFVLGLAFMSIFIMKFMTRQDPEIILFDSPHSQWMEFLTIPTGLTYLEFPHIWSILFFGMLILGCLNLLIVQLISVLTSLFDEFEILRGLKKGLTLALIGTLSLTSIFFCSNYGITFFETIAQISIISQMLLNFLLLIIVLWIYGRERLQRDVCFMTNRTYSTWMVNVVRYIAPIFIFINMLETAIFGSIHFFKLPNEIMTFGITFISILPWLFVPGYCIFKLLQTTGAFWTRITRCLRPTDWYPVETMDRRNYEDRFSEMEVSHNLTTSRNFGVDELNRNVFSAIPLFHLFHSLRPTIPWSCEGAKEWMEIEEINKSVIQLLSLLTSLFDEFEQLRENKQRIIYGTVGVFVVTSILFCSNHGVYSFGVLSKYSILTQMILNLLLILVVLWIYGRERFQRDLNFMTSRTYSTWMVYIVRFVAPIFLLVALLTGLIILMEFDYAPSSNGIIVLLFVTLMFLLSWCLIPGYCIYKIKHTTGIIGMRFRRSVRPTDWYPADPVYKQRYEESFNTTDISHQLTIKCFVLLKHSLKMEYETSYDTGTKPFKHDTNRGKWKSSRDFFFSCVGHAFRPDIITIVPYVVFQASGVYALVPYFIILSVCVVPIVFIQSFLGQFSGTGFISAFRIAPLFKGIGYVSLAVNFVNLSYYSIFSVIPFYFFTNSFKPTIPWSCQGASQWMNTSITVCNANHNMGDKVPSVEYLRRHFHLLDGSSSNPNEGTFFSVSLMVRTVVIWAYATAILLKSTESIGKFLRNSFLALVVIMSVCLLRFLFLPGAFKGLFTVFFPADGLGNHFEEIVIFIPIMAFSAFGPGWGTIISMASYNNFKTNIYKYSWLICLGQLGVLIGMACILSCLKDFMLTIGIKRALPKAGEWTEFLTFPTALTFMEWPNLWNMLFAIIIGLGSFNLLIIQMFSLLTSLFDEFESLREKKRKVIYGIIAVLLLTSLLFCSNHGIYFFEVLLKFSAITQVILNLLLILVVLWVYGRERFQRDLEFMISQTYSTWKVFVVRFVAPIFLLSGLVFGWVLLVLSVVFHRYIPSSGGILLSIALLFFLFSWCLIPCYCLAKIKQTVGSIGQRLRRCVRPTDWYPADPQYKQSYEERFSKGDTAHQLTISLNQ
ncbi:uncharacterized protein LOC129950780 [Eupeodes corollae]|uniref:uncharacterized protein LOC129950780 n=1 Tax=Eupeodes corollae TaxID=290404 RepID=UPI00248FCE60|nr:uncharacterized protein LOC129950780 [Eupeodes corollae]